MTWRDEARTVEVLLEEEPTSAHGAGAPDDAAPDDAAPRPGGRGRRWRVPAVAALAALVVTLGTADALADRRERRALDAYAHVPGVLGSLAEPPREMWRLATSAVLATADGVVVTAEGPDVVGRASATGETRWTAGPVQGRVGCPLTIERDDGTASLLCGGGLGPVGAGLQVLDPATGEVGGRVGTSGLVLDAAAVDGDLVLVEQGAGTGPTVARLDVQRDEAVWTVDLGDHDSLTGYRVHGDRAVVALEGSTTVVLDARDGRELARLDAVPFGLRPRVARVVSHPRSGFGVWTTRGRGIWHSPDGTPGARLEGEPVEAEVDDGGTPGVLLLRPLGGDPLRAVDVATGAELWVRPSPDRILLHLGGLLVVSGDGRLEAWDVTTGDVAWSVALDPGDEPQLGRPYTDGVRVLVRGQDDDGPRLTAHRISDGARVWRAPLPDGTEHVTVLDDRLAAVGRFGGRGEAAVVLG